MKSMRLVAAKSMYGTIASVGSLALAQASNTDFVNELLPS